MNSNQELCTRVMVKSRVQHVFEFPTNSQLIGDVAYENFESIIIPYIILPLLSPKNFFRETFWYYSRFTLSRFRLNRVVLAVFARFSSKTANISIQKKIPESKPSQNRERTQGCSRTRTKKRTKRVKICMASTKK